MPALRLALDDIELIYRSAEDAAWAAALERLRQVFASDACAIVRHDFASGEGAYLHQVGYRPELIESYPQRHARANPWLRDPARFSRPGDAWTGRELASDRELLQSAFWAQWLRPQDLLHQSCGVIARDGAAVVYLENLRRTARPAFDRRHLRPYAWLLPHLERAWTLARLLPALEHAEAAAGGAVVPRGGGILVAAAGSAAPLGAEVIPLPQRPGGSAATRAWAPAPANDQADGDPRLAAIAATPYFLDASAEERLRLLYRLTRAEARLAMLLAGGRTLQAAAAALNVGLATVRTHLQRIFAKTGTARQTELVLLLLRGPAALPRD